MCVQCWTCYFISDSFISVIKQCCCHTQLHIDNMTSKMNESTMFDAVNRSLCKTNICNWKSRYFGSFLASHASLKLHRRPHNLKNLSRCLMIRMRQTHAGRWRIHNWKQTQCAFYFEEIFMQSYDVGLSLFAWIKLITLPVTNNWIISYF